MRFWIIGLVFIVACLTALFVFATAQKALPPSDPSQSVIFAPGLIARGESLAAIGNCDTCHTATGGARLAGGRGIPTPFGTIYSTNITPDRDTGLGSWSEPAFQRAMRDGVSRDGHYLYPAFPYDHFTRVTPQDIHALFAYLQSRPGVVSPAHTNSVWPLLKIRRLMAVWDWLFLKRTAQLDDPKQSPEWNRGAYLAEGLGHCGACHTPRNLLGAERSGHAFAGGSAEGWDAYALNAASPAPVAWDAESLAAFLKTGSHPQHGNARGPMLPVTEDLTRVSDAEVHAIATYVSSKMLTASNPTPAATGDVHIGDASSGAALFAASCASCHSNGDPPPFGGLDFRMSTAVNAPDPRNLILVTLAGLPAADGRAAGMMPGFDGAISDQDLAALLSFLRQNFTAQAPWRNLKHSVARARRALKDKVAP
jgi:mono/diheme cytochrome c family protein